MRGCSVRMFPPNDTPCGADETRNELSIPHRPVLVQGQKVALYSGAQPLGSCQEHSHPWIQTIFLLDSASCAVAHRGPSGERCQRTFSGRQVCCIPAHTSHFESWGGESPLLEAYFAPSFIAGLPPEDVMAVLVRDSLDSAARDSVLWMLVSALRQLCAESPRPSLPLLEAVALALGHRLFQRHGRRAPQFIGTKLAPERLQRVINHIDARLGETRELRVPKLAAIVSLSPAHFTEVFHNTTGLSPMDYVRECRFVKAHEMALKGDHRLGEIADAAGFVDTSHLNREFARFFGYLPRFLRSRGFAAEDTEKPATGLAS